MLTLEFVHRHNSLTALPTIELPPLTVVTGLNGAGKSHLLQAIVSGAVRLTRGGVVVTPDKIRHYDWNSLLPNDTGATSVTNLYSDRDTIINHAEQARNSLLPQINQILAAQNVVSDIDPWDLARMDSSQLRKTIASDEKAAHLGPLLKQMADAVTNQLRQTLGGEPWHSRLFEVEHKVGCKAGLVVLDDFVTHRFRWLDVDLFQQSLGHLFLSYFEMMKQNRFRALDAFEGRTPSEPALTDEEFVGKFGKPPWQFLNEVLVEANLPFKIDRPVSFESGVYTPKLTNLATRAVMPFSSLSSGEKVLMSFALAIYNVNNQLQSVKQPSVLLLDEVDATLHPSMSKQLIGVICRSIVAKSKIPVAMTTHSPSTVAVCPEESIFVMRAGVPGLNKVTKSVALNVLTSGIPTLSISFSGRRQVFVESSYDAERFEVIYQIMKARLGHERSLVFIGAGQKTKVGDLNSGCDQVRLVVSSLAAAGNTTVFGLVDFDGDRVGTDRLHVLGVGERYSIENCLLDPLLLLAAIFRERKNLDTDYMLPKGMSYASLVTLRGAELQSSVDLVIKELLKIDSLEAEECADVAYVGGFSLRIPKKFLLMNGHALEALVVQKYSFLKKFHNPGELLMFISSKIISDVPDWVPAVVRDAFTTLLSVEV